MQFLRTHGQRAAFFKTLQTVYPVSCQRLCRGRNDRDWLVQVLAGGARIVQLRDKESSDRALLAKAHFFREQTRRAGALFIVNDRLDIALLADADGIHVGQQDLPVAEIRRLAPDLLIGLSCNTEEQAREVGRLVRKDPELLSYYNIGPLYPTSTKAKLADFLGPEAISRFRRHVALPFTVMGGIKLAHIPELVRQGAQRLAVVTAITRADDMARETRLWMERINEAIQGQRKRGAR